MKYLLATAAAVAFVTPALADFYIVQDTTTKRCQIVEQRPTSSTMTIVGGGKVFTSRTEAESSLKSIEVCSSGTSGMGGSSTETTTTIQRQ
ncbi:MAG: hypothetical protein ACJ8ED_14505 [Xanthobacteraceae bacterium]|jgi:hypothetical protein